MAGSLGLSKAGRPHAGQNSCEDLGWQHEGDAAMVTQVIGKADPLASLLTEYRPEQGPAKLADQSRNSAHTPRAEVAPSESASSPHRREGDELARSMAKVKEVLQSAGLQVRLLVDRETERVVVRVVKESGEVIRQFPPEEILEMVKYLSEKQQSGSEKGMLLEERV